MGDEKPVVTKELLEAILGEPVQNFHTREGSSEGDNVASVLTSVVATTPAKEIRHLLFKVFPNMGHNAFEDIASQERMTRFFTTEHMFYRKVVPLFESIVDAHLAESIKSEYTLPCAKYYDNGLKPTTVDPNCIGTVWVKDLRPEGYKMMNKLDGYTLAETDLILTELGKFHAVSYMMLRQFGEKLFDEQLAHIKVNMWTFPEARAEWQGMFDGHWRNVMRLLKSQGHDAWVEKLRKIQPEDIFDLALRTACWTDKKYFPLVIHGDLWTNNILLKFDDQNRPISVKFVDFQLSRRGNIYEELLYFIYCSTKPEFRERHLTAGLCSYYKSFTNFLDALGCPKPVNFTLGSFLDEFDANRLSAYMYMTFAIPLQLSTFSLAGDNGNSDSEGAGAETENQTPFVKMLYNMIKNSPPALQRLEDITSEMIHTKVL